MSDAEENPANDPPVDETPSGDTPPVDDTSSGAPGDDPLLQSVDNRALPDVTESMRLVQRAQQGDDAAMNELIQRYEPRLRRIVRIKLSYRLRRVVESVDIVQDTFRAAAEHIEDLELRSTASILQWLSRIAENRMLDTHRHFYGLKRDKTREVRMADPRGEDDAGEFRPGAVVPDAGPTPEEEASRRELARLVDEAVAQLPEDYREVIMLRTYYGGSWDYVAEQMNRTNGDAARQLHRRARIRLARIMREKTAGLDEDDES